MKVADLGKAVAAAGVAVAAGGVSVGAAAVGVGVAALELSGRSHPDIWSNAWAVFGVVIGGIGLLIAVVVVIIGLLRFMVGLLHRKAGTTDDRASEPSSTQTVSTTVTSRRDMLSPDHVHGTKEILTELGEIINEIVGIPTAQVTPDKNFVDDISIDSLEMVEIAVAAQDKFDVEISDEQLKNLKTVQDVVNLISMSTNT